MREAIHIEEVKRHIQCCIDTENCLFCSFFKEGCDKSTFGKLMLNSVQQLERERDAAVKDLSELIAELGLCFYCKHFDGESGCEKFRNDENCWEWCGVQEVE